MNYIKLFSLTILFLSFIRNIYAKEDYSNPLYMPKKGEVITETNLQHGRGSNKNNRYSKFTINENVKFAIKDNLFFNINFDYNFRHTIKNNNKEDSFYKVKMKNEFQNLQIGLEKRTHTTPLFINVGGKLHFSEPEERSLFYNSFQERDGLEIYLEAGKNISFYNILLQAGTKYHFKNKVSETNDTTEQISKDKLSFDYYLLLKNNFNIKDKFFINLDLGYGNLGRRVFGNGVKFDSSTYFSYNFEINYSIPDTTAMIGLYNTGYFYENFNIRDENLIENKVNSLQKFDFGIKVITKF